MLIIFFLIIRPPKQAIGIVTSFQYPLKKYDTRNEVTITINTINNSFKKSLLFHHLIHSTIILYLIFKIFIRSISRYRYYLNTNLDNKIYLHNDINNLFID